MAREFQKPQDTHIFPGQPNFGVSCFQGALKIVGFLLVSLYLLKTTQQKTGCPKQKTNACLPRTLSLACLEVVRSFPQAWAGSAGISSATHFRSSGWANRNPNFLFTTSFTHFPNTWSLHDPLNMGKFWVLTNHFSRVMGDSR